MVAEGQREGKPFSSTKPISGTEGELQHPQWLQRRNNRVSKYFKFTTFYYPETGKQFFGPYDNRYYKCFANKVIKIVSISNEEV